MITASSSPTKYVLVIRDKQGTRLSSATSPKDLASACASAQSLMQITHGAVSVDVYAYVSGWKLENASSPVETVLRKKER